MHERHDFRGCDQMLFFSLEQFKEHLMREHAASFAISMAPYAQRELGLSRWDTILKYQEDSRHITALMKNPKK